MDKKLVFIYDGECPFCNHFAELIELKSNIPYLEIKDARNKPPELPREYDIDSKGALLVTSNQMLSGAEAINFICSKLSDPSDPLLKILKLIFISSKRSSFIFPFLIKARRFALFAKRVPMKIT